MTTEAPTGVVPAPLIRSPSAFPNRADRQNRTYNTKAEGWATSIVTTAEDMEAAAEATASNAQWSQMQAQAAEQIRLAAVAQTTAIKNQAVAETGAIRDQALAARDAAASSAATAQGLANYQGRWPELAGALAKGATVWHQGHYWGLLDNLADVTAAEPGQSAAWAAVGTQVHRLTYEQRGDLRNLGYPGLEWALVDGLGLFCHSSAANDRKKALSSAVNNDNSWPNLLPNGDFSDGLVGWTTSAMQLSTHPTWGVQIVASQFSGTTAAECAWIPVIAGRSYIASGDSILIDATAGTVYIDMQFYDAAGLLLLDAEQSPIAEAHDFSLTTRWRAAIAVENKAPAGAVSASVRLIAQGIAGPATVGFRQIKLVDTAGDSAQPDDDESCFKTAEGAWLLQCPAFDLVDAWMHVASAPLRDAVATLQATAAPLRRSTTSSIATVAAGARVSFDVSIPGAVRSRSAMVSAPADLAAALLVQARVSALDTVTVYLSNPSAAAASVSTGEFQVTVI